MDSRDTTIARVFSPLSELDATTRRRLELQVGALYGVFYMLGYALLLWGGYALKQISWGNPTPWEEGLIGFAVLLPLLVITGTLGAFIQHGTWRGLIWISAGIVLGMLTSHIPYDFLSVIHAWHDPYPSNLIAYPYDALATMSLGYIIFFTLVSGLVTGLLQNSIQGRAVDAAIAQRTIGWPTLRVLMLTVLPLGAVTGLLVNEYLHFIPDAVLSTASAALHTAADPRTDLRAEQVTFLAPFRTRLAAPFTLYWNDAPADIATSSIAIDARFTNGLFLRCYFASQRIINCEDMDAAAHGWLTQLFTTADIPCAAGSCAITLAPAARTWVATARPTLGTLTATSLYAHTGPWFYFRATFDSGKQVDCRFTGAHPITLDWCDYATR